MQKLHTLSKMLKCTSRNFNEVQNKIAHKYIRSTRSICWLILQLQRPTTSVK